MSEFQSFQTLCHSSPSDTLLHFKEFIHILDLVVKDVIFTILND